MSEDRVMALELAVAHQGRTIEEMSAEMARQGAAIDRLEKTLRQLAERFLALEESAQGAAEATRPPHW